MNLRKAVSSRAFTLIELLVVILIVGILIAVAAPSFLGQQDTAKDSSTKQSLTVARKAAKAIWTTNSAYPSLGSEGAAGTVLGELKASEPGYSFAANNTGDVAGVISVVREDADSLSMCEKSSSGRFFCLQTDENAGLTVLAAAPQALPRTLDGLLGVEDAFAATKTDVLRSNGATEAAARAALTPSAGDPTKAETTGGLGKAGWNDVVSPEATASGPSGPMNLDFVSAGDTNGILYWLGTKGKTTSYVNPVPSKVPDLMSSQLNSLTPLASASDRGASAVPTHTKNLSSSERIRWDFGQNKLKLTRYTLQGRSDDPTQNPRYWVIEGSNDTVSWTNLDTQSNSPLVPGEWSVFTASSDQAYRYLRLRQTGSNTTGDTYLVIGEVEFYGELSESAVSTPPTESTTLSHVSDGDTNGILYWLGSENKTKAYANPVYGVISGGMSSQQIFNGSIYEPAKFPQASDRVTGTYPATTDNKTNSWMRWDFGTRKIRPTHYTLQGRTDGDFGYYPRYWVLEGSDDAGSWTTLETNEFDTSVGYGTWASRPISTTNSYRYLRLRQTSVNSSGTTYHFLVGEVEFYGEVTG